MTTDGASVAMLFACAVMGCGPSVGTPATGGGGSGMGSGGADESSSGEDTGEESGACVSTVVATAAGAMSPVISDGFGYWSQVDGTVWRVVLGEEVGAAEPVATPAEASTGLLADGGRLLLVGSETLAWHVLGDATTQVLAEGQASPLSPAMWNDQLLWLNYGSGILAGSLMRVAADGAGVQPVTVLDGLGTPKALAIDGGEAFVLAQRAPDQLDGALLEVDPASGTTVVRVAETDGASDLALTSDRVVWVEHGVQGPGRVRSIDRADGASAETLVTVDEGMPITVAADEASVYFGVFAPAQASVLRLEAGAAVPVVEGTWPEAVVDVALSSRYALVTANPTASATAPVDSVTVLCRE